MKTIFILTSGGDAPGMNAAVRAVAKVAAAAGVRTVGVLDGYDGLMDGKWKDLTQPGESGLAVIPELDSAGSLGGTLIGSARSARFRTVEGRREAIARLHDAAGLIVVGGDGSLTGAHLLSKECELPILGIPASIDNDIGCTATAIGVDTALNTIVESCDRICDTAISHRRAFVVEVMGRHSGYLAMASAIAAGADAVLFREQAGSEEDIVSTVSKAIRAAFDSEVGKRRVLILKAEGVDIPCTRLVRRVEETLSPVLPGVEIRATVLGHLVRGGRPSFQDRMVAARLGRAAVAALLRGERDQMVGWQKATQSGLPTEDPSVYRYPLAQVLAETKALLDGTSPVTKWRVKMMSEMSGVLGL
ncbi:MAG: ATP-dependent 6-phosphofructokinase [Myxococcales bacterium]|nr:ATP-dependent 6-phosphofructokinase [Myxococcales bacterium]